MTTASGTGAAAASEHKRYRCMVCSAPYFANESWNDNYTSKCSTCVTSPALPKCLVCNCEFKNGASDICSHCTRELANVGASRTTSTCSPERREGLRQISAIGQETHEPKLPTDSQARKNLPVASGVLGYFPLAVAYVALVSKVGNDQHNPGQPLHWAREKSTDHKDCIARHLIDAGTSDTDGLRHSGKMAWRALANLETELEAAIAAGLEPFDLEGK